MQSEADAALKKPPVQIIIDVDRPGNPVYSDESNPLTGFRRASPTTDS
jgi:hypothetical protein